PNHASTSVHLPGPPEPCAKAALQSFKQAVRLQKKPDTLTPAQKQQQSIYRRTQISRRNSAGEKSRLERFDSFVDIANVILFPASDEARVIHGASVFDNGGKDRSGSLAAIRLFVQRTCGLADHQFRQNCIVAGNVCLPANPLQQDARSRDAHLIKRLAYGRDAGVVEGCALNVVEAYHRNVFGNTQSDFSNGPDGSNGRDVVVADQGGETDLAVKQITDRLISQLRRGNTRLELQGQFGPHGDVHFCSHCLQTIPTVVRV